MLNRRFRWIAATWLLSFWCNVFVAAQEGDKPSALETTPPPEAKTSAPVDAKVEEVLPAVFYLPDKQGNLQAVLDFRYEDFVELYKLKQRIEQHEQRPRYSFQRLSITGSAGTENAELTIQFQILLGDADWVRVPLRLDQGLLLEPAQYQGPGEHVVHFAGQGEGYVSWIHGKKEGLHEITLKMLVPLSVVGEETKLKLFAPRATRSELKLKVAQVDAVGTVSAGATILPVADEQAEGTLFEVLGVGGEFELAWHKAGDRVAEIPPILETTGNISVRFDNRGITSEATLAVHSYSSPFDRFAVRLPPGAEVLPGNTPGYTLHPLEAKDEQDSRQPLVEVRLHKKTAGPIEVRLSTRHKLEEDRLSEGVELSGFEVVGSARQWGTIAVAAGNNRQVVFASQQGVRQIDLLPESLRGEDVIAGFEYAAQPYTLRARLAPRKTRINVDQEYLFLVESDRLRLEAKLVYFIRGAKVNVLSLAMPDWELDEAGPENLVIADAVERNESGLVSLPLQQPLSGQVELRLHAHKILPKAANTFSFSLPLPQVVSPGPATVAVLPADNVELTPDGKAIKGLTRLQIAPPLKLPERRQEPLFYRGEGQAAVFAAAMQVHSRRVTVDVASQVNLAEESAGVEQKLTYSIAYEAVDHLVLDVPQALAGPNRIEIERDGKPLAAKIISASEDSPVPAGRAQMRVSLSGPTIGLCELIVRYNASMPPLETLSPAPWSVPLVMPINAESTGNKLSLTGAPGIKIIGHGDVWKSAEKGLEFINRQSGLEFQADQLQSSFNLEVQPEERGESKAIVGERAWIQTWLTSSARQDRAVFQFIDNQKELVLQLPGGTAMDLVILDGKRVEVKALGKNRFSLLFSGESESNHYLLELRYHFTDPRPPRGPMLLEFPRFGSDVWMRRMYWQLVMPQNEHVIVNPPGFVGEYRWHWSGYYWGRESLLDQTQLENWIGTAHHAVLPEGVNAYLYSVLGNADHAELRTADRTWLVLTASGAALILGLSLIYVPLARHPLILLVLALSLVSLTMINPEQAALFAQTSGLGLALTLMAGLLERAMARRRKAVLLREPAKVIRDLTSTQSPQPSLPTSSPGSSTRALTPVAQSLPLPEEPPR